jgi:hypothetical protein
MQTERISPRSIVAALLLIAALAVAGCGSDEKSSGDAKSDGSGADTTEQKADLSATCDALTEMKNALKKADEIDVKDVSDVTRLVTQFSRVNSKFEELNAEVEKLPADAQDEWKTAEGGFRIEFVDAISDLTDAASGDNPANDAGKAMTKAQTAFDYAYSGVDCP